MAADVSLEHMKQRLIGQIDLLEQLHAEKALYCEVLARVTQNAFSLADKKGGEPALDDFFKPLNQRIQKFQGKVIHPTRSFFYQAGKLSVAVAVIAALAKYFESPLATFEYWGYSVTPIKMETAQSISKLAKILS